MLLESFLEVLHSHLFWQALVGNIREEIDGHEIFSFLVDFNEGFHTQLRSFEFYG
jgi:hypothetical protein